MLTVTWSSPTRVLLVSWQCHLGNLIRRADIVWLGHTKVIIKTDNEWASVALKHRVAKTLKEWKSMNNVQAERPAAYESQSNGGIEVGIKIVRGLFRTLELCLEARLRKCISTNHALVPWLLQHTLACC